MKGRVWIRNSIIGLIVFLVCLPFLLSQVVKYLLTSELEERGMAAVSVESLWMNPYTGVASIEALKFSRDETDYHLNKLELDLTLSDLWGRKVRVSGVRLIDANLTVQQDAEGNLIINGISLADDSTQEVVEDVVADDEIEGEHGVTWQFALDSVGVENVHVWVDLPEVFVDVTLERLAIEKLDTGNELDVGESQKASAELQLTLTKLRLPDAEAEASLVLGLTSALDLKRLGPDDWSLTALSDLKVSDLHFKAPQATVALPKTHMELDTNASYAPEKWALSAKTQTTFTELDVNAPEAAVKLPQLTIKLDTNADSVGEAESAIRTLAAQTTLTLSKLDVKAPQAVVKLPKSVFKLKADAKMQGADTTLSTHSNVSLTNLDVNAPQAAVKLSSVDLESGTDIRSEGEGWVVATKAKTVLAGLDVNAPEAKVNVAKSTLNLDAGATLGESPSYQAKAKFVADKVAVKDGANQTDWADLKQLTLDSTFDGSALSVKKLLLSGLNLLPSETVPTLVADTDFQIEGMIATLPVEAKEGTKAQDLNVVIDKVTLPKANITFIRDDKGEMPQLAALSSEVAGGQGSASKTQTGSKAQTVSKTQEVSKTQPAVNNPSAVNNQSDINSNSPDKSVGAPVLIKLISIGPDVAVNISDQGVKPAFEEKVQFKTLDIKNLSLSDKAAQADLLMELGLSNDAVVNASGQFNAASESANIKLNLDGYQLLTLSGYSEQFTGYALEAGVFNLDSTVKMTNQVLDTNNQAIITHVTLRPEHSDQAEKFAHSLTMPLDQALDLLRDSDDKITLEVPVKGALNDPDVDIQQIINTAMAGAMKKASMLVLQSLLQPYGAIISVAKMAGEKMTEVHLDPVRFVAGSAELDAVAKDYSGKIAAMINAREALTIKLCGVTNPQDLQILSGQGNSEAVLDAAAKEALVEKHREDLSKLGADRTSAVKQYLQTDLKVKSQQLLVCLPEYREDTSAPSGVVLSI